MKVVDLFFKGINSNDPSLISKIAQHDSMTRSVHEQKDGHWSLRVRPLTYDMEPANYGPEKVLERCWDPIVLVNDHIAVFGAPYDFYIDGIFSHCGTDAINLLKVDGIWKIGNSSRTVQKTDSIRHPEGPP